MSGNKNRFGFLLCLIGFLLFFSNAYADSASSRDQRSLQIQGISGTLGTLGYSGFAVGVHATDWAYFGFESFNSSGNYEASSSDSSSDTNLEWAFSTSQFYIRLSPFSGSGLFLQGGTVRRDWTFDVSQTGEIGDSGQYAKATVEFEFPNAASNYALGLNWISDSGISFGLGGGYINGKPPVAKDITVEGISITEAQKEKELENIESENRDILDQLANLPYLFLQLGYNF